MTIENKYRTVNGVRLHYLRAGSGPRAIVLTHGNSHCGGVWAPLVEALAGDEYTIVAPDLRGHGWSEKPESGYDWTSLRSDLIGLVADLGLREIVFAGHSRGGGVALLTAAATPDRTRGAFVYEPTVSVRAGDDGRPAPVPQPPRIAELAERSLRRRDVFPTRDEFIARYRSQDAFRDWRQDYFDAFVEYGSTVREDGSVELCVPPRVVSKLYEATFGFEPWGDVYRPDLSVTVVFGGRSGRVGPGGAPAAGIRSMFPRLETNVMPNATHTGPMEQPEEFERLLRSFLRDIAF